MPKHTPGKWIIKEIANEKDKETFGRMMTCFKKDNNFEITKEDGHQTFGYVAVVNGTYPANAHLIASAPELLEACIHSRALLASYAPMKVILYKS